jgi:uncharacterized protein
MIKRLTKLSLQRVRLEGPMWNPRIESLARTTLPQQYRQLEETGRFENFRKVIAGESGGYIGMFFNDSDVYKWIEAASRVLYGARQEVPDTDPFIALRAMVDDAAGLVCSAQQPDGYLNTYFALMEPDKRWTNLGMMSELYCAGHLFEAAVAHHEGTGEVTLLNAATAFADHIDDRFRVQGAPGTSGHEEIELALVKLAYATDTPRYVDLAKLFVERRGTKDAGFQEEITRLESIAGFGYVSPVDNIGTRSVEQFYRDFFLGDDGRFDGSYAQTHKPVRQQETAEGHAVRQAYLSSSVVDLAVETNDEELLAANARQWRNMTTRRMYITGGIGAAKRFEGFSRDWHLPNREAYAETCAAVGNVLWSERLLRATGDARYADVMEVTLFNGLLSGIGLDGESYFYMNPLESDGTIARQPWYNVACCPPNVARLLANLPSLLYSQDGTSVYAQLYGSSHAELELPDGVAVQITQTTDYPWDGAVEFSVSPELPVVMTLYLRWPEWCSNMSVSINGDSLFEGTQSRDSATIDGYVPISREWRTKDTVSVTMEMEPRIIIAHPSVSEDAGRVALKRGPIVYCLEQCDHDDPLDDIALKPNVELSSAFDEGLLGGCVVLRGKGWVTDHEGWRESLYRGADEAAAHTRQVDITAVPYFLWCNRETGPMRVWHPLSGISE